MVRNGRNGHGHYAQDGDFMGPCIKNDASRCGFPSPIGGLHCEKDVGHAGTCGTLNGMTGWWGYPENDGRSRSKTARDADVYYGGNSTRDRIKRAGGSHAFITYCISQIIRYGSRLGKKPGASIESDRTKLLDYADWALEEMQLLDRNNSRSSHSGGTAVGTCEDSGSSHTKDR